MIRICIWASGSGSNAENMVHHFRKSGTAEVALILTNRPEAAVIARAKRLGVACLVFSNTEFKEGTPVLKAMQLAEIDWVILGGFLRLVPETVISAYPHKIINIHPALLPKYGGKGMYGHKVHEAVVAAQESESGITIHEVNAAYDEGMVLFQAKCPVEPTDTAEMVEQKVRALEIAHYPTVVAELIRK